MPTQSSVTAQNPEFPGQHAGISTAAQMSPAAARGPPCQAPPPPTAKDILRRTAAGTPWGWAAHHHPAGPPTFTALECKIFPEPEPQSASQSQTCPEMHTGPPNPDISPFHPYPSVISLGIPRVNMFIYKIHRPSLPACNAWESERSRGPHTPETPPKSTRREGAGPGRGWKDTAAPPPSNPLVGKGWRGSAPSQGHDLVSSLFMYSCKAFKRASISAMSVAW